MSRDSRPTDMKMSERFVDILLGDAPGAVVMIYKDDDGDNGLLIRASNLSPQEFVGQLEVAKLDILHKISEEYHEIDHREG
jgi:hypothetical protein